MEDLSDLVWSTVTTTSNGRSSPLPSSNNGSNNAGGPNPFSSNSQYNSPQKPISTFGSYRQNTLNAPNSPLLSGSPRNYSSGNTLSHKVSLNKMTSDPFESLVNLGALTKKTSTANLSLEEQRKIKLESQKNHALLSNAGRSASPADKQFWEQLDTRTPNVPPKSVPLTPSRSFSPSIGNMSPADNRQQKQNTMDPFDELLESTLTGGNNANIFPPKLNSPFVNSKPLNTESFSLPVDSWNLDFLEQDSNMTKGSSNSLMDDDPFGLGAFTGPSMTSSTSSKVEKPTFSKRNSNPLGILASPIPRKIEQSEESSDSEEFIEESGIFNNRDDHFSPVDSDLDRLIAKVMNMGFDYEQARSALEISGNDFQTAIEILVENQNAEDRFAYHKQQHPPRLPRRSHISRNSSDEEDYRQQTPAWKSEKSQYISPRNNGQRRESGEKLGSDMASFQVRKEKFISNASTVGASVLSKANVFVKQASEKIRESIDDIQQRRENLQKEDNVSRRSGRPRWLQNSSDNNSSNEDRYPSSYHRYKEEFLNDKVRSPFSSPKQDKPSMESYYTIRRAQSQDSLRYRRAPPPRPPISLKSRVSYKPPVTPKSPRLTRPPRYVVSATPEQLQLSERQKTAGTDKFKLGQFGDAEELYSKAISTLPPNHDNVILLYNNLAASRIKV
ncbi:auxilin-like clathrin-binding protein required for normal clathrin function [Basidiobolus ranarum]|uniref:Auxilin-like clathrin-binding protein required for normal clathrin function n=1 Tax=Basidiobolus ranarum TaxID=34480 RepID=A0ABR2WGT3_9FUNG